MTCKKQRYCNLCDNRTLDGDPNGRLVSFDGMVGNFLPIAPVRLEMAVEYGALIYGSFRRKWKPNTIIRLCDGCLDRALKLS